METPTDATRDFGETFQTCVRQRGDTVFHNYKNVSRTIKNTTFIADCYYVNCIFFLQTIKKLRLIEKTSVLHAPSRILCTSIYTEKWRLIIIIIPFTRRRSPLHTADSPTTEPDSGQLMMNFSLFIFFLLSVTRHNRAFDPDRFVTFVHKANAYKIEDIFITIIIQQIGMRALSDPSSTGVSTDDSNRCHIIHDNTMYNNL